MENYEGLFILDPDLAQDAMKAAITTVTDTIAKQGGSVGETQEWGRRKLSYVIKKKREGYYVLVNFAIATDAIVRLHQQYKLNEQVMKYLITRRLPPRRMKEPRAPRKQPQAADAPQPVETAARAE